MTASIPEHSAHVLLLDKDSDVLARASTSNPSRAAFSSNLAYLIYTSGSTGRPKGVSIEHRNAVSFLFWARTVFKPEMLSGLLASTSIAFDLSVFELFLPLSLGGTVVLANNALELPNLPASQRVSLVNTVPSAISELLRSGGLPSSVRVVNLAGEPLATSLVQQLYQQPGLSLVYDLYGPSETTTYSTFTLRHSDKPATIGRPISGTQVYLLDSHLQPVPMGVPGEVFIAGAGVSRGYLGRPELTADRFVPDPFCSTPGSRMYRTGDLARYRADGNLEYLGRTDFQVKVRGFRIELGEIETVLDKHPGVRQVVVVAREDRPGDKRLVAYLTPSGTQAPTTAELRSFLKEHLPEYMVPSAFVVLEQLPLTPNGKVNRKALPAPEASADSAAEYIAPRTPTEQQLASIWAEVLSVPRVGAEDHFFELGGHSLMATRVLSRVRSAFHVELPVRVLFEAPTLSALARKLDETISKRAGGVARAPALKPTPRTDDSPLSFAQQRLWFLDQFEPGSVFYNLPAALRLSGRVDTEALRRAFEALVLRHESLRTTFATRDGQPVQVIAPALSVPLEVVDLQDVPATERESQARELIRQEALRPFELANGPLVRTSLLRLAPDDHVLLVTQHHIISDGWSISVLVREVTALYAAFAAGQHPALPALPIQYADFALWQHSWLQGEALDMQLRYWRQQLSGAPALLELPTDKPRPAVRGHRGALHTFLLPRSLAEALTTTSTQHGVSLFMTLLAGFQALLHRYSGQDDVSVGSPIAGRRSTELEGLIGFFVNTLVLRSRLSPGMTLRELLLQVRDTTLGAYEHQDVPFEKLVEELSPQRSLGHSPLFQVMFSLQNTPTEELRLPGLTLRPVDLEVSTSKFDLSLALSEGPQGLTGFLTYNTDLFEPDTVARMMRHYLVLLEALSARPDTALSELSLLSSEERQQLLVAWNDTRADFPRDATLHSLVQAQASRTPDAIAIELEDAHLTYRQLDEASTRLAHHLRALGVGPGSRVALCFERSPELLVSLLATLHAGAAWVPLDPEYPRERLELMLQDCGASLLLTRTSLLEALPSTHVHVLRVDSLESLDALPHGTTSLPTPDASSPAYVIYTSGSTGRPKGVQVAHRAAVNHLHWRQQHFPMGPRDAFLQKASFSFDISVWEMFAPLVAGARLVLARPGGQRDSEYLVQAVVRHSITHLHFGPSPLSAFLQTPGVERCHSLRFVFCGGEPLSSELHSRFVSTLSARLVHQYGPTETCIDSTAWVSPSQPVSSLPIGRPISNTQVYVLDERLRPVPLGVPGELLIGGEGLAWGYLNRPELTAEKFVPHPFSDIPGARLYRTGDKVRWRADGTLEFLGRLDFQVKVRGFRIELGEIESVLARHPSVRQSLVIAREDRPGDKRLVAYVVPSQQQASTAELRAFLEKHLPEYMVPSAFVVLEELPLTPNGKVNRKALPPPEASVSDAEYIAPRTPTEQQLATIWAEILGVPRVGAEDHFFELGGHSLMATQVVSRLRSAFHVELPVRALFEAPTLSALARRIDDANRQQSRGAMQAPALRPAPRTGDIPLAFSQQRLWFLDQLEPGSPVYNIPAAIRLSGRVDTEALRRAFEALVRRHETLRTTFASRDGEPVQLIAPSLSVPLEVVELQDVPATEREVRAQHLAHQEAQRPFDLANGPLVRTSLLRLDANDHVLLVTLHHIISDGWSTGVLVREVASLYAAFAAGRQLSLPPLPIQYADFALWQRSWLQGEVLEAELNHWKQQLSGAPAHLELATDKPRPPMQTFRGDSVRVALPRELSESIKALSVRLGVTPFMTLLAGFQVLLHRYSRQDDISVGSPIAGRRNTELEGLIGFFINTLVLRSRFSAGMSFRELLLQVRDTTLAAYEHQDIPFEKLVEELQPQRDLSRSPLFQVMFILQNAPSETLQLPGLTLHQLPQSSGTSKFDWTLALTDTPNGFAGGLEYNVDLFERDTIVRATEHLRILLEAAVAHPEARLSELPLLSDAEQHKLLVEFNGPSADYPREATLHQLIEAQVERTPDAVALTFEGQSLTYRELDSRANQLAWHLRSLGVGPESRVGLCLERSLEMVVALLATLKAGGAYVPLDPAYPQERLGWMLEDARPTVLLVQQRLLPVLPTQSAHVVCLDSGWADISEQPRHAPAPLATAHNLAYIIFTSGSTGRPKGAMNEHHAVVNRLLWMQDEYKLEARDVVLQKTPFSFDVSVWEFFWPLMRGARLVLAKPGGHQEPGYLASLIARERVTTLHFVPSMLKVFLEEPDLEARCASLRRVVCSGEALPVEFQDECLQRLPQAGLHNLYGPTEAAVDVTYYACEPSQALRSVPIGRPVANTQIRILDAHFQPVPVGVSGELYIGGVQVGRGYLSRPHLTAERFIPDPFSSTPGARMYRTGDVARWLPDGNIEYLGRADFQVKIRGLRIELGEIEAHLAQHPAVRQAVVIAREDRPGDKRLVAYVVASPEQASAAELRAFLQPRLPEHMVPSAFVALEKLPLSPNGKLERRALPAPETTVSKAEYIAPRTPTEELLAGIWVEVLGVPRVGAEDNFFELGGHSLLATRVLSRLRSAFEVELPVRALFEAPTLSALALKLDEARRSRHAPRPSRLRSIVREGDIPLAFAQQRLWFLDQLEPGSPAYNLPVANRLSGPLNTEALHRAFEELVRRHESLRTTFASRDGQPIQVIAPSLSVPLEVVDLQDVPAAERETRARELARQEALRPFDLVNGPLLRATLLRLGSDDHVLVFVMHHIVSDGWSMGVLVREVATLYVAFASGQQPSLPALPVQYADFALWQRSWLQGEVLDSQMRYWKQQLSGAPAHLELATDKPRPPVQTFRGDNVSVALPKALSESIKSLSMRLGATPFMTLLAGFQVLLHRYSRQDDISVGSPIAGRRDAELEGLIGFFVNTLVLRSRVSAGMSFRELLLQVRDTTLAAYEHQDLPFEKLVEQLQPQRDLSRTPFFQVMFVLQNAPAEALRLRQDLTLKPVSLAGGTSKFDWTLALTDTPEGFAGGLEYNIDLFERDTVVRAVEHLRFLLEAAVAHPETRLSELPLLSEAEQRKLLVEWNDTHADAPRDATIHELFEAQAARTPDALAVLFGQQSLTFRELDVRANQLAHALRGLGVGPDIPVALCVEPSLEMVIGLMGILKAGGTYVPLDPAHPADRLAFMLEDSRAPLLLTQAHLVGTLPAFSGQVLRLDADWQSLSAHGDAAPRHRTTPDNLAYIIYTSGSTGRPKGVMVPHRGVPNLVQAQARAFGIRPGSRVLQFASFSFDASISEVAVTLLSGATLCLARRDSLMPGPGLVALLREQAINVVTFPPSLLALLPVEGLDSLHTVVSAGEACSPELVSRWASPGRRFLNGYGPTETTVCATMATCVPDGQRPPIGRPLPNVQLYVLDEHQQPAPIGVPGELYIGGVGVSRGYLNRPELTAEKFIPDPFSGDAGARLYRTGDLVRYRADGNLEYLGRTDFQVKVRGFRIELGEIESVLDKHSGVRQSIVIAREDRPGDKRLVAYVVSSDQQAPTTAELRAHLKEHLPEYMVPSAFMVLEQLPLSPNGKVDRRALPAPEASVSDAEYIAPRTPTEQQLATIWAEVLGVPRVGAEDNFFELGGHSLLATRVLSRLRTAFEVELPVRALFEAPTLSALARRIDDANRQQSRGALQAPPLRPAPRTGDIPLAFTQQRLWFLDQLEPGSPAYNIPVALRFSGSLNAEALRQAFEELVRRHESLRTTFVARDGQPVQIIAPSIPVPLEVVDLQDVPAAEREAQAQHLARQEAQRPFDLANGPLLRASLLRLDANDHVLLVTLHHIVSDGWSMGVLVREVASLYAAFAAGRQPSLPPLPVQYADFALWQRSWLQGEVLEAELNHWKQQLSGAPMHLELATDKPRPPVQTFRGDSVRMALPKELSESIKALSMRLGITPFMTLLAGFQVLLHRYSRQDDISVGSPIAGRRSTELEGLIGFFINNLVLRARFSSGMSFRDLLLQVRDTTLAAYEHQDLPFEKLVEELQPQRDLSRSPLFQVMFILQNAPAETLQLPGLALRQLPQSSGTSKFDWTLALTDTPNGFAGGLEYNVDLFERDTIVRATEHLRILLEAAVSNPDTRLSELPLLPEAEKHKLLVEWNDLPLDYPREATLHQLFEAQVERTPDAEALIDGTRSLTYSELNARANQLAHSLRSLGVGPETPVGICSRRSADLVVGLLGILKAGGLYVPLDPAYPRERLGFIVEDAQLRFLVAQSSVTESLPPHSAHVLLLDKDAETLSRAPTHNPTRAAFSSNLAYLIYTSGSTGRPKGVSIEHRNAVSFLFWARTVFKPEMLSGLLASTSIAFDLSVFELFLPLSLGGTVVLANNALELPNLPAAQRVSLINTVPSAISELLRSGGLPSSVRVVNLAGEPLATSLVQQLYQQPGLSLVYDLYGPSETTTYSTFTLRHSDKPATIGRPISGTQVYLLDDNLRPVPTGVPGEVFIAGAGVSRGYLGRPELTAEKFMPDPFSSTPGARMYRTGDLARYRADGNLEYLGRTDFQVKVRGFRIELGEIETVLDKHPGVRQVVVVAREDRPGDKRLVAYLTPSGTQVPTTTELRSFLKQHLPEHMVPSVFVVLEQLPLTPNGKVNRKALPAPEASTDSAAEYIAPRTPTEELLAGIWAEVLSVPRVGIRDNFFELGGHSLLATRLTSRVFQVLERRVSVLTLFQNPTIELLAEALRQQQDASEAPRALVKLQAGEPHLRPLFLVHAAGGGVMSYTDLIGHLDAARPVYGLHDPALDGAEPMPASVEAMARHYVAQIREVQPHGPYYLGGWSFGGVLAFEMAQQLQAAGEKVDLLTLFDTHAPGKKGEVDELNVLSAFCHNLGLSWQDLPLDSERLLQLSGRERLAYVLEQASGVVGGGAVVDLDQAWRLYETFMRHIRAQQSYEPRPYAGSAVLFKASTQPEGVAPDGRLGWSAWITGAFELQEVPGAHHTMLNEPHAAPLAERLTHHLKTLDQREAA